MQEWSEFMWKDLLSVKKKRELIPYSISGIIIDRVYIDMDHVALKP